MASILYSDDFQLPGEVRRQVKTLSNLRCEVMNWDKNPPYQRGDVWKEKKKIALIESIMQDIPVNSIHLVKYKDSRDRHYVLDGKQRITALEDFFQNKFKVAFKINNKKVKFNWTEMNESDNDDIIFFRNKIDAFNIDYIIYDYMDFDQQRIVFSRINYSEQLNPDERIYCPNFHTKALFEYIYKQCPGNLLRHFDDTRVRNNYRYTTLFIFHTVFFLCFGKDFSNTTTCITEAGKGSIGESAKLIHDKLVDYEFSSNDDFSPELLESMDIKDNIELFIKIMKLTSDILNYNNTISKKMSKIQMQDFFIFLIRNCQENEFTPSFIKTNLPFFNTFLSHYKQRIINYKSDGTTQAKKIADRQKQIDLWFIEFVQIWHEKNPKIDLGLKNQKWSKVDETILRFKLNPRCSECDTMLSHDNFSIDHIEPKSLSSNTRIQALCKTCNSRKGNYVPKQNMKFSLKKSEIPIA